MNTKPRTVNPGATVEEATNIFSDPNNNPVPVVMDGKLVGILSLSDITKLYGVSLRSNQLREADQKIEQFVEDFEKQFILVTKKRAHTWLLVSILITPETIKNQVPDWNDRLFYISGPEPMVAAYKKMLKGIGITENSIVTDFFPGYEA